ncbi:MAG: 4-hydroxy-tetrahydrodipicolinate synthase [Bacillota bacterium]|nr:4-hydroxy-tetrahydrodipicolinate synthase [Bacillota bacterium]
MKKAPRGMFVPVVTPFKEDQSIDFDAFKKVIDYVVEGGLDGILISGSTGEYHTMTLEEQKEVIKKGCEYVAGRIPVLAGVGRYTAPETVELANFAADCGAEWGLVLPPYYQATTDQGVKDFFLEIADGSNVGIVIYNNPLSTGVELAPELIAELAEHDNIVSLKDTSDMIHTCETIALTRNMPNFTVFQGYEHTILPALAVGAEGGFAILMNALPQEYVKLYNLVKENKWAEAAEFNMSMAKLYTAMEAEPYPAPVKAMMEMLGVPGGCVRKPLVDASDKLKAEMKEELKKLGRI